MERPEWTAFCDDCGAALPLSSDNQPLPCPSCGCARRQFRLEISDSITVHSYMRVKASPAQRDRRLPEGGVTRSYQGVRQGRDGRLVNRAAHYDPHADLAEERVVDLETGEVIVEKSESMRAKYLREDRWKPPRDQ